MAKNHVVIVLRNGILDTVYAEHPDRLSVVLVDQDDGVEDPTDEWRVSDPPVLGTAAIPDDVREAFRKTEEEDKKE